MDIFVELADNEMSSCRRVVRFNSLKWSHLGLHRVRPGALLVGRLAGGTGSENL